MRQALPVLRRAASLGLSLVVVGAALAASPVPAAPAPGPSFYDAVSRGVVRLEHYDVIERDGSDLVETVGHSDGTGFLVAAGDRLFVVSAAHVAHSRWDLKVRVVGENREGTGISVAGLRIPRDAWVFHPKGPSVTPDGKPVAAVDVAVAEVPWHPELRLRTIGYCPDPCDSEVTDQFADQDPDPPAMLLTFGFPKGLGFELREQRPMARTGIVSMVAGEHFVHTGEAFLDARARLLDTDIFPGNSGSPVFSNPVLGGPFELLGVVTAANDTFDFAVSEPVSRVKEVLEHAFKHPAANRGRWEDAQPHPHSHP